MKKHIYITMAALCAILVSCSKGIEFDDQKPQSIVITEISASSGADTRAKIDEDNGTKINWESGDALKVFGLNSSSTAANADYTLSSEVGKTGGIFRNAKSTVATIQACMYPTQSAAKWSDSKLTCNIPTVQTAVAGSFDKTAGIMYSIGSSTAVKLKSAVAYLKVTVSESNVHSITISSSSTVLSGNVEITSSGVTAASTGTVNSVTLVAPSTTDKTYDNCLESGKSYYIAVKPGEIANPSISYAYIDATNHKATVKTKASSKNLSVDAADVKTITISNWTSATEREAIQLWGNGPYFATMNIGAASVFDYGGYYCWGGTENRSEGGYYTGVLDSGNILPSAYDTATKLWNSGWRIPTSVELEAIVNNTSPYPKDFKVGEAIMTMKICEGKGSYKANNLYLPYAGICIQWEILHVNYQGDYWSSTYAPKSYSYALAFFENINIGMTMKKLSNACSVRAVLR